MIFFKRAILLASTLVIVNGCGASPSPDSKPTAADQGAGGGARLESIKTLMRQVDDRTKYKGPFGKNVRQGPDCRSPITAINGRCGLYFDAAFRTEQAEQLASLGFYVGNRFATNYYRLYETYMHVSAPSFTISYDRFLAQAAAAPEAWLIAKHTLFELYHWQTDRSSGIARAYGSRGISGSEYESPFLQHLLRYMARHMTSDQLLLFTEYARRTRAPERSNGVSLEQLRAVVAGVSPTGGGPMNLIRNAIHNQMNPYVLTMVENGGGQNLTNLVRTYYRVTLEKIRADANGLKSMGVSTDAIAPLNSGSSMTDLAHSVRALRGEFLRLREPAVAMLMVDISTHIVTQAKTNPGAPGVSEAARAAAYALGFADDEASVSAETARQKIQAALAPALGDWTAVTTSAGGLVDAILATSPVNALGR